MSRLTTYKKNILNIIIIAGIYYIIANVLVGFLLGLVQDALALKFTSLGAQAQEQITSQGQPVATFITTVIPAATPWLLLTIAVIAFIATVSIISLTPTLERTHKVTQKNWKHRTNKAIKATIWFVIAIVVSRIIYLIVRLILIGPTTRNPALSEVRGILDILFFSFIIAAFLATLAKAMHDFSWKITVKKASISLVILMMFAALVAVLPLIHILETAAALALLTALTIEITRPENTNV